MVEISSSLIRDFGPSILTLENKKKSSNNGYPDVEIQILSDTKY